MSFIPAIVAGVSIYEAFSRDDAEQAIYRANIEYLEEQRNLLGAELFNNIISVDYASDILEGQQRAVLNKLNISGTSELSRALFSETRAQANRRKGMYLLQATVRDKKLRTLIEHNLDKINDLDSLWNMMGNVLEGLNIGLRAGKIVDQFVGILDKDKAPPLPDYDLEDIPSLFRSSEWEPSLELLESPYRLKERRRKRGYREGPDVRGKLDVFRTRAIPLEKDK